MTTGIVGAVKRTLRIPQTMCKPAEDHLWRVEIPLPVQRDQQDQWRSDAELLTVQRLQSHPGSSPGLIDRKS